MAGRDPLGSGRGSGARDPLASRGKKKKGHGGVLGALESVGGAVTKTSEGFAKKAVGIGPGLVDLWNAQAHDVFKLEEKLGLHTPSTDAAAKEPFRIPPIVKATGRQTVKDFTKPNGDFSGAILDVIGAASLGAGTAARVSTAGRLAKAGEAGSAARALVKGPGPQARTIRVPGTKETVDAGTYSRAASSRAVQKGLDKLREKHPNVRFGLRNQHQRVGHERQINQRYEERIANFNNKALLAKSKKLGKAQQFAVQIVNEKVPLSVRIADAMKFRAEAPNTRVAKMLDNHIKILTQTQKYVHDVEGMPRFRPAHSSLVDVYEHARAVANKRDEDLIAAGLLKPATAAAAKARVAAYYAGNHHFNADHVPELQSDFFISYRNTKNPSRLGEPPQIGNGAQVGIPRRLSELSHPFTGESIKTGNVNPKAVERVAVDSQRANKALSVWRHRDELGRLAVDTKQTEHHIPIRPIWLKNKKWPQEIRDAIDELQRDLTPDEELSVNRRLHDFVFPEKSASVGAQANGVKWIDRRYLGDLNIPKTLGAGEKVGKVADRVNTPFRALTLFKPGYVPANLGNNIFLNVIQQPLAARANLARASRVDAHLGSEAAAQIDTLMGEGKTASIGQAAGLGQKLNAGANKIQRGLGRVVDVVPRRAAFYHEAARFGYHTDADILRLLNNPALKPDLIRVSREANSEIIDYANLGAAEQALVRRVIFFYPWVKGATMYGGRFLKEHPVKAAAAGQVGQQGSDLVRKLYGDLPLYAQGIVKTPWGFVNTEALNNLPQAAQSVETIVGLLTGHPKRSAQLLSQASPVVQAAFSGSNNRSAPGTLAGASLIRLAQEAASPSKSNKKVYPQSERDALLRFLLGGAAPRDINLAAAHTQAAKEQAGR